MMRNLLLISILSQYIFTLLPKNGGFKPKSAVIHCPKLISNMSPTNPKFTDKIIPFTKVIVLF